MRWLFIYSAINSYCAWCSYRLITSFGLSPCEWNITVNRFSTPRMQYICCKKLNINWGTLSDKGQQGEPYIKNKLSTKAFTIVLVSMFEKDTVLTSSETNMLLLTRNDFRALWWESSLVRQWLHIPAVLMLEKVAGRYYSIEELACVCAADATLCDCVVIK